MEILIDKKTLRKEALSKRAEFNKKKESLILTKILNSADFKNAKNIALYFPINNEIDITPLLNTKGKNFYFTRCNDDILEFVKFESKELIVCGKFNIPEPIGQTINPQILDLIYIPALMANKRCYRLGYGKGYYDKFFAKEKISAKKCIVIACELICDKFIEEENDFKCDCLISA